MIDEKEVESDGVSVNGETVSPSPLQVELDLVRKQLVGCQQECEGMRDEVAMKDEQIGALKDGVSGACVELSVRVEDGQRAGGINVWLHFTHL